MKMDGLDTKGFLGKVVLFAFLTLKTCNGSEMKGIEKMVKAKRI